MTVVKFKICVLLLVLVTLVLTFMQTSWNHIFLRPKNTEEPLEWLDMNIVTDISNYGDGSCGDNKFRKRLTGLLQKWNAITVKQNITYFLAWGTLLGAWRHQDIIPYDHDLDLFITTKDAEKLEKVKDKRDFTESDDEYHLILQEDWRKPYNKRRRFNCQSKLVDEKIDQCSFEEPLGRLIKGYFYLDIYEAQEEEDKVIDMSVWKKIYNRADIFPLKKCMYMGELSHCPNKPAAVLEILFGKDFMTPNRVCKNGKWSEQGIF